MAATGQRHEAVEIAAGAGDDPGTAGAVVAAAADRAAFLRDHVGAVEGIVERAPAGIGGIEGVAGVRDRHDELRPGDAGDLAIDVLRPYRHRPRIGQEIPDLPQVRLVGRGIERLAGALPVPGVELPLERIALGEQGPVLRRQVAHDRTEAAPEHLGRNAGAGQRLVGNEVVEHAGDGEAADIHSIHLQSIPGRRAAEYHLGCSCQPPMAINRSEDKTRGRALHGSRPSNGRTTVSPRAARHREGLPRADDAIRPVRRALQHPSERLHPACRIRIDQGVSNVNSSRFVPGPPRSTTRKSWGAPNGVSTPCHVPIA